MGEVVAKDADGDKIVYRAIRLAGAPFVVVPQTGEVVLTEKPNQRMYLIQVCSGNLYLKLKLIN